MIKYLFFLLIIPLIITPAFAATYTSNAPVINRMQDGIGASPTCDTAPTYTRSLSSIEVQVPDSDAAGNCESTAIMYNVTSIPDGSFITDITLTGLNVTSFVGTPSFTCNIRQISGGNITLMTDTNVGNDIHDGNFYITGGTFCQTVANNYSLDLGALANIDLRNMLGNNTFSFGFSASNMWSRTAGGGLDIVVMGDTPRLTVTYNPSNPPNAVTDLVSTSIGYNSVALSWSTPGLNGGTLTGYEINSTTPWNSNVATINVLNTSSSATTATVSSLTSSTQYSFRVGAWTDGGINGSGNVLNITTLTDPSGAYTVGSFTLNATGTDQRPIAFQRVDINSTALTLNVDYDNTFNLACDLKYKFANTNTTYTNLASAVVDSDTNRTTFQFTGVNNEIIGVKCWDQNTNTTGRYVITQTSSFPLLTQIASFRAGDFGTSGDFGALDLITIFAIIVSMVGMNRVNESVGVIFGIVIFGGLSVAGVFGIVDWPPIITAGVALVVMLAIMRTRQD